MKSNWDALYRMISGGQEVVSHNMETVGSLYRRVRPQAKYERSLEQIKLTKEFGKRTKTGIMLGLGEKKEEVLTAMDHLVQHGCDILTLGQYLQPTKMHIEVAEFIHPDLFAEYREEGLKRGLKYVESGPLVRSSYHAGDMLTFKTKWLPIGSHYCFHSTFLFKLIQSQLHTLQQEYSYRQDSCRHMQNQSFLLLARTFLPLQRLSGIPLFSGVRHRPFSCKHHFSRMRSIFQHIFDTVSFSFLYFADFFTNR